MTDVGRAPVSTYIERFVRESNYIEGIEETTDAHIAAHCKFLDRAVTIPAIVELVSILQPNARFRNAVNIPGVRVGNHVAPPSGPDIEGNLRLILAMRDPWEQHISYETLHPFTDGNGRSGRAIWLHRHFHEGDLDQWAVRRGFLHSWYYHTLSSVRLASVDTHPKGEDAKQASFMGSAVPKADAQTPPSKDPTMTPQEHITEDDVGRLTGSREPSPGGLGPSGFNPAYGRTQNE